MHLPHLNANDDDTWSVSASSELEALEFVNGLNNVLAHIELDTPEKIATWIAEQQQEDEE